MGLHKQSWNRESVGTHVVEVHDGAISIEGLCQLNDGISPLREELFENFLLIVAENYAVNICLSRIIIVCDGLLLLSDLLEGGCDTHFFADIIERDLEAVSFADFDKFDELTVDRGYGMRVRVNEVCFVIVPSKLRRVLSASTET